MPTLLSRDTQYTVRTPVYEGPLDLLLDLIQRAELDITALSLAAVTNQFLEYVHSLGEARADEMSVFLVMAARLLQIKSEALLPRPPARAAGEEDLAQSLVDQLRLYKRYKEIGQWLDARQQAGLRTYLRVAAPRITIREKIGLIGKALRTLSRSSFRALLGHKPSRLEVVVTFLALLELIKRYRVQVHQESLFSDIEVQRLEDWGDEEDIDIEFE